jgi:hypothetical protein
MCDYSLQGINNRLAIEGERLVVHRFHTGSIGMVSETDLVPVEKSGRRLWQWLFSSLETPRANCAVCIPPGATVILHNIPQNLRQEFGVQEVEEVTFTQVTAIANSYRDAVRFRNGAELLLQRLTVGQRVDVARLEMHEPARQPADAPGSMSPAV